MQEKAVRSERIVGVWRYQAHRGDRAPAWNALRETLDKSVRNESRYCKDLNGVKSMVQSPHSRDLFSGFLVRCCPESKFFRV